MCIWDIFCYTRNKKKDNVIRTNNTNNTNNTNIRDMVCSVSQFKYYPKPVYFMFSDQDIEDSYNKVLCIKDR